ncbi:F-box/kelch-repeat protein At3g23880-like [Mercurialis annua]|uniref:F-box/kelch-repeat protein At3g23880-like n=1 Tax=Mercurialis annua TaxID=3986 RepID=UPI00216023D1|nr:F-box/kelch-repeat protein At3g23880-like [Mercurialis annua]
MANGDKKGGLDAKFVHIPKEILQDILLKLDIKSLVRFKTVNTFWFSLISSHEFAQAQLSHVRDHKYRVIQLGNMHTPCPSVSLRIVNARDYYNNLVTIELRKVFGEVDRKQVSETVVEVFGSCNGMLLVSLGSYLKRFILWNPTIREYKTIRQLGYEFDPLYYLAGICCDETNDDYRVVVVVVSIAREISFAIYNNKKKCWERREKSYFPYNFYFNQAAVSPVNGILHWVVRRVDDDGEDREAVILSFDMVKNEFKEVPSPRNFPKDNYNNLVFVSAIDGFLCVSLRPEDCFPDRLNIWMMKEYGVEESWTKLSN